MIVNDFQRVTSESIQQVNVQEIPDALYYMTSVARELKKPKVPGSTSPLFNGPDNILRKFSSNEEIFSLFDFKVDQVKAL